MVRHMIICLALCACALPVQCQDSDPRRAAVEALEKRKQELQVALLKERVRIVREDGRAATINHKIQELYRELDQLVEDKPSVRQIRTDIREVEKLLKSSSPKLAREQ